MKIEIKIEESCTEPKIVIVTDRVTDKINEIIKKLSVEPSEVLAGFRDEQVTVLEPNEIDRIYASGGKVYAETKNDTFLLRLRLYEAEQRLANASFVRISNSEIINLKMLLKSNNYWDYEVEKMKKKVILRGLFGLPVGIAIGFVITLLISICIGDGAFYPVTPELIQTTGNQLNAVILQTILCAILGGGFAMASVIWEIDSWSLAKQSGVYFLVISVVMLPIAYFANWMKHSITGVLSYVGIFVMIFAAVWISQYLLWKRRIKKMNARIHGEDDQKRN